MPDGHPIVLNDGSKGCLPDQWGGTNFMPPSFDPALRLFFVTARETCATYLPVKQEIVPGRDLDERHGPARRRPELRRAARDRSDDGRAASGSSGIRRRRFAGVLSTASGVVFARRQRRQLHGVRLAHRQEPVALPDRLADLGRSPMTYMLDGRQHVLIGAGTTITAFALTGELICLRKNCALQGSELRRKIAAPRCHRRGRKGRQGFCG